MEKINESNQKQVQATLDKWLNLQKLIKEEITLNEVGKFKL